MAQVSSVFLSTEEFLSLFEGSYLQTFDDVKNRPGGSLSSLVKMGPKESFTIEDLHQLNAKGAGIFFTPNPCSGGRKEENVTEIRWAYVDMDEGTKEEMMEKINNAPLPPTMIIESKRSYHVYYRSDIKKENWSAIINGMIQYFDGDQAITSANEVLRLPGFIHQKDPENTFMIDLLMMNDNEYSEDHLEYCFPYKTFEKEFVDKFGDDLHDVKSVDILDVLQRVGVETRRGKIIEDGKETSAIVNRKENYVNRFSGKPGSGSTIDVVMHYKGLSTGRAINWIREEFHLEKPRLPSKQEILENNKEKNHLKGDGEEEKKELDAQFSFLQTKSLRDGILKNITDSNSRPYTWGTGKLDERFSPIQRGNYIVLAGETGTGKTVYSLFFAIENAKLGLKVLYLSLEMDNTGLMARYVRDRVGITIPELKTGEISDFKIRQIDKVVDSMPETLKFVDVNGEDRNSVDIIEAILEKEKFDLIIIDNLGFIEGEGTSETEKQAYVSRRILETCRDNKDVCVTVIHHFRKGKGEKERSIDELMGSAKLSHDVNYVVQVWRKRGDPDMTAKDKAMLSIYIQKDRDHGVEAKQSVFYNRGEFLDYYGDKASYEEINRIFAKDS